MHVQIHITTGRDAGASHAFQLAEGEPLVMGRGAECELPLWDEAASRRHAALLLTDGELRVRDLASANGLRVNGEPTRDGVLADGDRILIGETELRVATTRFRQRPTAVLERKPGADDDRFAVESALPREEVGSRLGSDAGVGERLSGLLAFVETVQGAQAAPPILEALLEQVATLAGSGCCALVPCAARSTDLLWDEVQTSSGSKRSPMSRSLAERVARDGHALLVSDARSDPRTRERDSIVQSGVRSILAAPVAARGRVHAVLSVEASTPAGQFQEPDLAYVAALGQIAGMALENAERLQHSQRLLRSRESQEGQDFITEDTAMRDVLEHLARFAAAGGPVLIRGETGTGKELLARHVHDSGDFRDGPWLPVNCAAIPPALLESELFGHERGAFTGAVARKEGMFELAHRGTLFLDEIAELPVELQPKLLRVLETGEFFRVGGRTPVRVQLLVVSATHRDLAACVTDGTFREDLYYRLARFNAEVPPLRERSADIALLATHFLAAAARRVGAHPATLSAAASAHLASYEWPGNIRELRNVLERAAVLARDGDISPADLGIGSGSGAPPEAEAPPPSLEQVEEHAIRAALRHTGGRKGEAAELLGIAWPTLRRKLQKYDIDSDSP